MLLALFGQACSLEESYLIVEVALDDKLPTPAIKGITQLAYGRNLDQMMSPDVGV